MTPPRRTFLQGLSLFGAALGFPKLVSATTLKALGLPELVAQSALVVETLPVDRRCEWANWAGARRIVTVTRVVHQSVWRGASSTGGESEVVTWGGRVGDIAQKVHGQARLTMGRPVLLFLQESAQELLEVTGMAQGQFTIIGRGADAHLERSEALPHVQPVPRLASATARLHRLRLGEAKKLVADIAAGLTQ